MNFMKYILNPYYLLRNDVKRAAICSQDVNHSPDIDVSENWLSFIHPIYAMLLSFFSLPIELSVASENIAVFFDFTKEYTDQLIQNFIENSEPFHTHYKNFDNDFPKNIIVRADIIHEQTIVYHPKDFVYTDIDLHSRRFYKAPLYVTFMISNKCLTNCIYCYADRYTKCKELDFSRVESIIDDACQSKIVSFNIDGGEFFLYPRWQELLEKLKGCNYLPEIISTKYPMDIDMIKDFSKFGINLQVSFDSVAQDTLDNMVGRINNYSARMQAALKNIDQVMSFQVATILTKYNGSIQEMEKMYTFLSTLHNVRRWEVRVGFKSLYSKKKFEDIQISRSSIEEIQHWIKDKQSSSKFEILWSPGKEVSFFKAKHGSADFVGSLCSANSLHMFILPDGKVTICEQLYWNKNFLIGDLAKMSISEVWNSPRALYLAHRQQNDYSSDSYCHKCKIFDTCKANLNDCFPNIMKVYGKEHWDYPDPRCDKAPRNISDKIYV